MSSSRLLTLDSYENDIDEADRRRLPFAEDDMAEFTAAKLAAVEQDAPKAVCTALPGWGDWVSERFDGISGARKRKFTDKLAAAAPKTHKDRKNPRVIINDPKLTFFCFYVAMKRLYKRVCPSVCRSVRRSVHPSVHP